MSTIACNESEDPFADLSTLAAAEFRHLVEQDSDLLPRWRAALLKLLEEGVPVSLEPLQKLMQEETHASPEKPQGESLPRAS